MYLNNIFLAPKFSVFCEIWALTASTRLNPERGWLENVYSLLTGGPRENLNIGFLAKIGSNLMKNDKIHLFLAFLRAFYGYTYIAN